MVKKKYYSYVVFGRLNPQIGVNIYFVTNILCSTTHCPLPWNLFKREINFEY